MSAQKRRFLEGSWGTPTFIGAESVFVGNIRGTGHFVVSGEVHGDGELHGGLNLSATGSWHGFVQAEQAIIAGKIGGGTIAIAKGAIVDGEIEVTSGAPLTQFEEKRDS